MEIFRHKMLRKTKGEPGYKWDIFIHSSGVFFPSFPAKLLYSFSALSRAMPPANRIFHNANIVARILHSNLRK